MRLFSRIFGPLSKQARADRLVRKGLAFVRAGRTAEAKAVAERLRALRYSGAFEVEAQALQHDGLVDEAIAVLQAGLAVAPGAWLNANLLGNYLSDQGRYDEAFAAHDAAIRAPGADPVLVAANHALALHRAGREAEASAKIAVVVDALDGKEGAEVRAFAVGIARDLHP